MYWAINSWISYSSSLQHGIKTPIVQEFSDIKVQKPRGLMYIIDWNLSRYLLGRPIGRDPFNQNFRKFRSKTEWIGSVQLEKFRKKRSTFRGGPLCSVGPVRLKWSVPFDHSDPFSIPGPRCSVSSMYKMEESTYHCAFIGLLTADLSVFIVHPCTLTTGL